MIGIFAKVLQGEPIKTRLQTKLSRAQAERFYLASLADTLETTAEIEPNPTLFLQGGDNAAAVDHLHAQLLEQGLDPKVWERLRLASQTGRDLGRKLEDAFESLFRYATHGSCALIVGSDSPSLDTGKLRRGLLYLFEEAEDGSRPDMVLGPTTDGGYWAIGLRRLTPGLLEDIAWSTDRALHDTQRRANRHGLRVQLLDEWSDVDHPEDLETLAQQIKELRSNGDTRTARHTEAFLQEMEKASLG
jgi:rSAM/selenodomain-associated transferase 1